MEVKCPKCSSRFNLPDQVAKNGVKLRCSVCSFVFPLERTDEKAAAQNDEKLVLPEKKKSKKRFILLSVLLFLLCLAGALAWQFFWNRNAEPSISDIELANKVKLLTMRNVRQYSVENEKVGKIFVIEGKVVNEFPEPKELIAVEGAIYSKDKRV
ncbi:MAG: zinc-ribbon domain-containing protein, partial [Desulfovibrio sp.]|nr:zinc-ribbon domain-containing protein [Desulfovibrio sp.]